MQLKYDWGEFVSPGIVAVLGLAHLNLQVPNGYYMASLSFKAERLPRLEEVLTTHSCVEKSKQNGAISFKLCRITAEVKNDIIIKLKTILIKPGEKTSNEESTPNLQPNGSSFYNHTFSNHQVEQFSVLSGDTNNIHSGQSPIVQGMLLFLAVEDYLASKGRTFKNAQAEFFKPVRTGQNVMLLEKHQEIHGYVNSQKCFTFNRRHTQW